MSLKEEYQAELDMQRDGTVPRSRAQLHNVVAKYTTNHDLGLISEGKREPYVYDLDDETRDRLIVHARQDAALASGIAASNEGRLVRIERLAWIAVILAAASILKLWW